jgi:hypothetical protein
VAHSSGLISFSVKTEKFISKIRVKLLTIGKQADILQSQIISIQNIRTPKMAYTIYEFGLPPCLAAPNRIIMLGHLGRPVRQGVGAEESTQV